MPGGRGCPEEEDARRTRMPGGRGWTDENITGRYVWNAAEQWIRIRPPMQEQMSDDNTLRSASSRTHTPEKPPDTEAGSI